MPDISEILGSYRVLEIGLFNDVSQILPRPSVVAMATKFELKLAISRLILYIQAPGVYHGVINVRGVH